LGRPDASRDCKGELFVRDDDEMCPTAASSCAVLFCSRRLCNWNVVRQAVRPPPCCQQQQQQQEALHWKANKRAGIYGWVVGMDEKEGQVGTRFTLRRSLCCALRLAFQQQTVAGRK